MYATFTVTDLYSLGLIALGLVLGLVFVVPYTFLSLRIYQVHGSHQYTRNYKVYWHTSSTNGKSTYLVPVLL